MKQDRRHIVMLIAVCVVSAGLVSSGAQAQNVQFGGGAGVYMPVTEEASDALRPCPGVHITGLIGLNMNAVKMEGSLGMWMLEDNLDRKEFDGYIVPLTGGARWYLTRGLHLDGGIGMYPISYRWESDIMEEEFDESDNQFGLYGGAGFEIRGFDLKVRAHWLDVEDVYIGANVNILFPIGTNPSRR